MSNSKGTLIVVVIRAKHLPDRSSGIGKPSPFATLTHGLTKHQTRSIKRGGQTPQFDEEFRFEVPAQEDDFLTAETAAISKSGGIIPLRESSGEALDSSTLDNGIKSMKIALFADDSKAPKMIGYAIVDLSVVFVKGEHDLWVPLEHKGRSAGEVYLELTFYSSTSRQLSQPGSTHAASHNFGSSSASHRCHPAELSESGVDLKAGGQSGAGYEIMQGSEYERNCQDPQAHFNYRHQDSQLVHSVHFQRPQARSRLASLSSQHFDQRRTVEDVEYQSPHFDTPLHSYINDFGYAPSSSASSLIPRHSMGGSQPEAGAYSNESPASDYNHYPPLPDLHHQQQLNFAPISLPPPPPPGLLPYSNAKEYSSVPSSFYDRHAISYDQ